MKFQTTFTETIKAFFPHSTIIDSALQFPITSTGWSVELLTKDECDFDNPDYYLVLNLQDMLSSDLNELDQIESHYSKFADMNRIIVCVWCTTLSKANYSFRIVEHSTHTVATVEQYKQYETELRQLFKHTNSEYKFLCMNRIEKQHRTTVAQKLHTLDTGNISMQSKGKELVYTNKTYTDYDVEYNNCTNLMSLAQNFNTSEFSVITESQYTTEYGIVTEKFYNTVVAQHPFIAVAQRNYCSQIQELGFKLYHCFDYGYDSVEDRYRIDKMLELNRVQLETGIDIEGCREVIDYNTEWFFNGFGTELQRRFESQLLRIWHSGDHQDPVAI